MAEVQVSIPVGSAGISLEGLFEEGRIGRSAVLCHPHPLFGGNMHNNVVEAARQTLAGLGWGTLRFNFRGTGRSGGTPAQEKTDAMDLFAVSEFLRDRSPGPIDFAAYSYGAWVTMEAVRTGLRPGSLILISPPLDFMSFEGFELSIDPVLITVGSKDEFCSIESLRNWLSSQPNPPALEVLTDVDHFYWGAERLLSEKVVKFLKARLSEEQLD